MLRAIHRDIPASGARIALEEAEGRHVAQVLRARVGDSLELLDGTGARANAVIEEISGRGRKVTVRVLARTDCPLQSPRLTVYLAPPRGKAMPRILRYATELGIAELCPIMTEFSTAKPSTDAVANWQTDVLEAAKQCGNPRIPIIYPPQTFAEALASVALPGFVAAVPEPGPAAQDEVPAECALWIGPEGGFSDPELELLRTRGFKNLSVGGWILRVETALVACTGVLLDRSSAT
ncbi:MAG TPA: hypothetical protein DCR55_03400 [Lentisphaeria bacterium]|nr:hypothetical protein [Lentisphaeria bacterium]